MFTDKDVKKKLFELTLAIYRITDLFPRGEAMIYRLRDVAGEILEDFTFYSAVHNKEIVGKSDILQRILGRIESLKALFQIANAQKFVNSLNFEILEWEYDRIRELVETELNSEKKQIKKETEIIEDKVYKITSGIIPKESLGNTLAKLNDRQREMVGYFKNNDGKAKLKEVMSKFPGVSEKTVRNDLKVLCERRFLKLNGRAPQSFYSLH